MISLLLIAALTTNPVDFDELKYQFKVEPRPTPVRQEKQVLLLHTTKVDLVAKLFGGVVHEPGDMIYKSEIMPDDIVMEATEDEQGKYLITYRAELDYRANDYDTYSTIKIVPDTRTAIIIQYEDKSKLIKQVTK